MSWHRTTRKKPDEEWTPVLGWDLKRGYSICYWFTHASGDVQWSVNGATGAMMKPPTHWMELPPSPSQLRTE